jgi:hypothetical protein
MALPMSIDEQRTLLTSIAEVATLGRSDLSLPCKESENNSSSLVTGEQRLVLGAF